MAKQAKFSKAFDYKKGGGPMTSYAKGYEGDVPDAHYDAAVAAGAIEGEKAKSDKQDGGQSGTSGGTSGGPTK